MKKRVALSGCFIIGFNAFLTNKTASLNTVMLTNALYNQSYDNGGSSWESGNVAFGYSALYLN